MMTKKARNILRRYAERKISRAAAAARLAVSQRQVNRMLHDVKLERVESPSHAVRDEAAKRRLAREQAAQAVHAGKITIEQAALRAGCSTRTIYRYLDLM